MIALLLCEELHIGRLATAFAQVVGMGNMYTHVSQLHEVLANIPD